MMDPHDMADFILKRHGALDFEELDFLVEIKKKVYFGSPTCAQDLHELTVLYHEAVGFWKATMKFGKDNSP